LLVMSKEFRAWKILIATGAPAAHNPARSPAATGIVALAREELDLSALAGSYRSVLGQPPFIRG